MSAQYQTITTGQTALAQAKDLLQRVRTKEDFRYIDGYIEYINYLIKAGLLAADDIEKLKQAWSPDFLNNTIQGFGLRKPYGYAGDFMIIDKIYRKEVSSIPRFKIWDEYFHEQAAPIAVRNRKDYFISQLKRVTSKTPISLLNVASGPCRDLLELYTVISNHDAVSTTCVEMDPNAVEYAESVLGKFKNNVEFVNKNIFKYSPTETYDVIWSAGLFDYFDDRAFRLLLKKFKSWVKPNGEIIIGNFNQDHNPSRAYMEIFGEWSLIHRTERQLIQLALDAGYNQEQITVGHEKQNVNLFLHINI